MAHNDCWSCRCGLEHPLSLGKCPYDQQARPPECDILVPGPSLEDALHCKLDQMYETLLLLKSLVADLQQSPIPQTEKVLHG